MLRQRLEERARPRDFQFRLQFGQEIDGALRFLRGRVDLPKQAECACQLDPCARQLIGRAALQEQINGILEDQAIRTLARVEHHVGDVEPPRSDGKAFQGFRAFTRAECNLERVASLDPRSTRERIVASNGSREV